MTSPRGSVLLLLAAVAAVFAGYVALTGGIDTHVFGVPLRSRSWERPAAVSAMLTAAAAFTFRRPLFALGLKLALLMGTGIRRLAGPLPVITACAAGIASIVFGTWVAGGADSYGYVSQAQLLAHGRLTDVMPRNRAFTWPSVPYTLTPLGYIEGTVRGTLAPTYPPGLPLLMAPLAVLDPRGPFLVVPICAAIAVWLCSRIGRDVGGPIVERLSAVLLAVSPTFLYQAVQPMSDVPATAFWLAALVLARHPASWSAPASGVVTSLAILIRPNLAPLALFVVAGAALLSGRVDLRRAAGCVAGMIPGLLALGAIQHARYGSPFASGYGKVSDLFAWPNIGPNLARYPRWLTETHTAFIWVWLLTPIAIIRAKNAVRTFGWICYAFSVAVFAAYLPYSYFRSDEWFYTRFLLPAIPLYLVLGTCVVVDTARRIPGRAATQCGVLLLVSIAVVLAVRSVRVGAFAVRAGEQKYPAVGAFVREQLPASAFVMAMQHSGSIRYYSGRHTLRWDLLDRAALERALSGLRAAGYTPFAVLDDDEAVAFKDRFGTLSREAVDRMQVVGRIGSTQIYGF